MGQKTDLGNSVIQIKSARKSAKAVLVEYEIATDDAGVLATDDDGNTAMYKK